MRRTLLLLAGTLALSAAATLPPPEATLEEKVCQSDSVLLGKASEFKIVRAPGCWRRGDGESLTLCQEVQVRVKVEEILRAGVAVPGESIIFRFGGGLFSVDDLRSDLLSGPRYFFLAAPTPGRRPVYRTSYPWFLGLVANADSTPAVKQALDSCPAPNNSIKPNLLRKSAYLGR